MNDKNIDRFEIVSKLALAVISGKDLTESTKTALEMASRYVDLSAAALYIWDGESKITLSVDYSNSVEAEKHLAALEKSMFSKLRKDKDLVSAYMTFRGEPDYHSFTLPLRFKKTIFGTVIGLQMGEKTLIKEENFLDTLTALLSLTYAIENFGKIQAESQDKLDKERTAAIVETAITVNHEINNPLTAILGNIQLLLMDQETLDKELVNKLEIVEESALKIKNVVQKLLRITTPRSIEYANGTNMIDLTDDEEEKPDK